MFFNKNVLLFLTCPSISTKTEFKSISLYKGISIFTVELAIPFEYQYVKWSKEQQERHFEHISKADIVTYVDTILQYNKYLPQKTYSPQKLQLRNIYMVDNADVVIAVWNGTPGGTKNCIDYAQKTGKEIIVVNNIF